PAIVWNPSTAKMFMAWFGSDSIGQLNVIQSTDMVNWNNKVHWAAPGTCCDWSNNQVGLDLTYNSDNQKIYLVYLIDEITNLCPTCTHSYQIWVHFNRLLIWNYRLRFARRALSRNLGGHLRVNIAGRDLSVRACEPIVWRLECASLQYQSAATPLRLPDGQRMLLSPLPQRNSVSRFHDRYNILPKPRLV